MSKKFCLFCVFVIILSFDFIECKDRSKSNAIPITPKKVGEIEVDVELMDENPIETTVPPDYESGLRPFGSETTDSESTGSELTSDEMAETTVPPDYELTVGNETTDSESTVSESTGSELTSDDTIETTVPPDYELTPGNETTDSEFITDDTGTETAGDEPTIDDIPDYPEYPTTYPPPIGVTSPADVSKPVTSEAPKEKSKRDIYLVISIAVIYIVFVTISMIWALFKLYLYVIADDVVYKEDKPPGTSDDKGEQILMKESDETLVEEEMNV